MLLAAGGWVLAGSLLPLEAQKAAAVPQLDLNRFFGTWYEIARLPDKPEKKCVGDAFMIYAAKSKAWDFSEVTSCQLKDGSASVRNLTGKRAEKKGSDGRLKVITIWPLSAKYWVLAVAPDYSWALLGTPNHKMVWVLSRTASLAPDVLTQAESQAASQGFNTGKLVMVAQTK
jgi:apolipoprotein D and lipocalin family protein